MGGGAEESRKGGDSITIADRNGAGCRSSACSTRLGRGAPQWKGRGESMGLGAPWKGEAAEGPCGEEQRRPARSNTAWCEAAALIRRMWVDVEQHVYCTLYPSR